MASSGRWVDRAERLVVVGAGMAGLKLIEELDVLAPGRYEITLVGAEGLPAYNRVLLSSLLAGESTYSDIELRPREWYGEHGIRLLTGEYATALRPALRDIVLASGAHLAYDRLVLATGSQPIRLPLPGAGLRGVMTFRELSDVAAMRAYKPGAPAVVIGGGLLGIEAAFGLAQRGLEVTLVHVMSRLMERQLDQRGADMLKLAIEAKGIRVLTGASTKTIEGDHEVGRIVLKDGTKIPASLVVMAVGVRPATTLAECGGLDVARGVKVDDKLESNWPQVYAIGECAEHRGVCYGLVEPAHDQARALARYLAGLPSRYDGSLLATNLKVSGVPVFSMGDFEGAGAECIVLEDASLGVYRKLVMQNGRLVGAVLVGDTADALWYRDLMRARTPVAQQRGMLAFGRAYAEAAQ